MRLNDNVWVDGKLWPTGCLPPAGVAEMIGEHAWEDGDPSVPAPQYPLVDDGRQDAVPVDEGDEQQVDVDGGAVDVDAPDPAGSDEDAPPVAPEDDPATEDVAPEPEPAVVEPEPTPEPAPPVDPSTLVEPPRVGRGSSKAAWADYAAALGLNTTADMSRDDIVELVDAHLALAGSQDVPA